MIDRSFFRCAAPFCVLTGLVLTGMHSAAFAQALPGSVNPGRFEERIEKPVIGPGDGRSAQPPPSAPLGPISAAKSGFILRSVTVVGATAFTQSRLAAITAEYIGLKVDMTTLDHLAARITQAYRDEGYLLSRVIVPPQTVVAGSASIMVIEGYVSAVTLEDPNGLLALDALRIVASTVAKIKAMRPLHGPTLERYLLLLNRLGGVEAEAIISALPGNNALPRAVALTLRLKRIDRETSYTLNNHGSRFAGPLQLSGKGSFGTPLVAFDSARLDGLVSAPLNEVRYLGGAYDMPLNEEGLTLELSGSLSRSAPGFTLKPLEIESASRAVAFGFSYPLICSRRQNLTLRTTLDAKNITTKSLGAELSRDRVRAARLAAQYDRQDSWGQTVMMMRLSHGLDALGARKTGSINLSRAEGRSDFTKVEASLSRLHVLPGEFQAVGSLEGQYASSPLLSSEQFGYGGQAFGRAYDSSEILGDRGVAFSLELRYAGLPVNVQPFGFYDVGKVFNQDHSGGLDQSGASAGLGGRFRLGGPVRGEAYVAWPLTRPIGTPITGNETSPRLNFSLTASF